MRWETHLLSYKNQIECLLLFQWEIIIINLNLALEVINRFFFIQKYGKRITSIIGNDINFDNYICNKYMRTSIFLSVI